MDKMRTLQIAQDNKDEILEYVLYDSIAISKIYKIFIKAVTKILADKCLQDDDLCTRFDIRSFLIEHSRDEAVYKCLYG